MGCASKIPDFGEYNKKIKPDIFEFHLSYSDLDINIDNISMVNINVVLLYTLLNYFLKVD